MESDGLSLQQQRLEEIKKILLEHHGKANPISAGKISEMLNIPHDDTVSTARALITKLILDEGMPIGAYGDGYFYIETVQELAEYVDYLDQKILQTTNRKTKIINNFENKYGKLNGKFTKIDDFW